MNNAFRVAKKLSRPKFFLSDNFDGVAHKCHGKLIRRRSRDFSNKIFPIEPNLDRYIIMAAAAVQSAIARNGHSPVDAYLSYYRRGNDLKCDTE